MRPTIAVGLCKFSREVVNALPYGGYRVVFIKFARFFGTSRDRAPQCENLPYEYNISLWFWYPLYMRRRHRNVAEGNTSYAKRTSRRRALHGTKSYFVSTKSIALPYGFYQDLCCFSAVLLPSTMPALMRRKAARYCSLKISSPRSAAEKRQAKRGSANLMINIFDRSAVFKM